jgi:signal transduction histidine kinase
VPKEIGKQTERVARLVHDVRTPLTVIQMLVYTLQQALTEDKRAKETLVKDLEMIKEETNKIEQLMSEYRKELSQ